MRASCGLQLADSAVARMTSLHQDDSTMKMDKAGCARTAFVIAIACALLGHAIAAEAASAPGITVTPAPAQPQIIHPATSTTVNVTETNDITILGWQESAPAHGTLQLPPNGCPTGAVSTCAITYTAAPGYIGQDQFTVSVT